MLPYIVLLIYNMTDLLSTEGMFFLSLSTVICSGIALSFKFCYKSKCAEVKICCIKIKRDINTERVEDLWQRTETIDINLPV